MDYGLVRARQQFGRSEIANCCWSLFLAGVAFGKANDKNATLSSSPANPPAFNAAQPAKFGTVTAAPASDKLDIHSFFTGGGNQAQPNAQGQDRRSVATFDPQARSPAHQNQPLPQMHAATQPFNPRGGPQRIGAPSIPAFVPGQSQAGGYPSPGPQYSTSPYNAQPIPFKPAGTPSQNIPNGSPYGGPGGQQQPGSRNGSFVGSPVMQPRLSGVQPNNGPNRPYNGPTSPRLPTSGLPQQQMAPQPFYPQQGYYQGAQQYQAYYQGQPQSHIPPPAQYGQQSTSGSSTPSAGVRTPAPVAPSPSPSHALTPGGAPFVPGASYSSPVPSAAQLPTAPHLSQSQHSSYGGTPLRAPTSGGSTPFTPREFKPSGESAAFVPSPRINKAIKIMRPPPKTETDVKPKAAPAAPTPATEDAEAKKAEEAKAVEVKAAEAKKAEDEAAAKKVQEDKDAAEKTAAEEKAAAEKKEAADKAAAVSAAEAKEATDKVAATEEAEKEKVAEQKAQQDEAADTLAAARADVPSAPLPSHLPSKPVNGATEAEAEAEAPVAGPSSISTATPITNIAEVTYPQEIQPVRADLNAQAESGKYRYDREFLMQFMAVCTEKPEQLPNLESIGMVDAGGDGSMSRNTSFGGSNRRSSTMGPPAPRAGGGAFGRSVSTGGVGAFGGMGNFGQGGTLSSSEARFAASRSASTAFGGGRTPGGSMSRTSSQSGFVPAAGGQRIRSERGKRRDDPKSGPGGSRGAPGKDGHVTGQGFEGATLEKSENRWVPTLPGAPAPPASDENSPELVQRKVKALLNKLTVEKFDSISDQILAWADKSVNETDGRILRQVIALIFEKATDEAAWSEMYAKLCRKLMEKVSSDVKDESVKAADGKPVAGGALFRKYLLNRCQEDYESGWKQKEASAAAAASKAADDSAKKDANDAAEAKAKEDGSSSEPKEAELLSDEYYAAAKAKRRGLGLVRFIGELFRLSMLTERIMHECIKKLLANTENPEEEDVESLCRLLTTVGKMLDNPKAKQHMDIYFSRMNVIKNNDKVVSRMRFMIVDVCDLRDKKWQARHESTGPKTIAEVHAEAQKAQEESARRTASSTGKGLPRLHDQLSRPNSRRGQGRDSFGVAAPGADGWSNVPQRPAKAGDLTGFGKIRDSSSAGISLAPGGAFAKRNQAKQAERPATPSNPFALLEAAEAASASASQRPKLNLAPRTKPVEGEEDAKPEEDAAEESEDDGAIDPNAVSMSRAEGERRAGNSVKEFFSVKNLAEGVASVEALPKEYRAYLIIALGDAAMDKKADDVNLTRQLYAEILSKKVVSHETMLESLTPMVKTLVDLAVDVPSAYTFATQLLLGAGASREEMVELSTKMASEDEEEEEVEMGRESLLAAFDKLTAQ